MTTDPSHAGAGAASGTAPGAVPRICMILASDGRNDSRVMREAAALREAGCQVTIAALAGAGMPAEEIVDEVRILRVRFETPAQRVRRWLRPRRASAKHDAHGGELARAAGPPSHSALTWLLRQIAGYALAPSGWRSHQRAIEQRLAGERFDVYHAHDFETLPVAAALAQRDSAKLVYDSHELWVDRDLQRPPSAMVRQWWMARERRFIRRADAVITVNQSLSEELARRYGINPPTVVMNIPARAEREPRGASPLREASGAAAGQRTLLYVGAIFGNRGLEQIVDALPALVNVHLAALGYGEASYLAALRQRAARAGVESRVSFVGPVRPHEVVQWARGADAGIIAIQNVCESYYLCLPNKFFEYLAAGLPIVASDFPELRRLVEGYELGALFDPAQPTQIAHAVRAVLDDEAEYARLRRNAVEAAGQFTWEEQAERLRQVYRRIGIAIAHQSRPS